MLFHDSIDAPVEVAVAMHELQLGDWQHGVPTWHWQAWFGGEGGFGGGVAQVGVIMI